MRNHRAYQKPHSPSSPFKMMMTAGELGDGAIQKYPCDLRIELTLALVFSNLAHIRMGGFHSRHPRLDSMESKLEISCTMLEESSFAQKMKENSVALIEEMLFQHRILNAEEMHQFRA